MMKSRIPRETGWMSLIRTSCLAAMVSFILSCASIHTNVGTTEQRLALLDYLIETTQDREAFSEIKNERLGLSIIDSMRTMRSEFAEANSDSKLFYALSKLSNMRRDRHLSVSTLNEGLRPEEWPNSDPDVLISSVRFCADFADSNNRFLFVCDIARDLENGQITLGDKLLGVDERSFESYQVFMESYLRHSSIDGFWWKFAEMASLAHPSIPGSYRTEVAYKLENQNGVSYIVRSDFRNINKVMFSGTTARRFDGFEKVEDLRTFDLYRHNEKDVLLLDWYGFREYLVRDINWLMRYASKEGLLDFDIVFDATRSRGGSKGAYAIQALFDRPFKTTFGNLKISDVTEEFVDTRERDYKRRMAFLDGGVSETIDDGSWLIQWLVDDVRDSIENGDEYSNNVPFKLAHAPKDSDGVLQAAEKHFTGRVVVLLGPHGGSHLDQFAAIVKDNKLAPIIGMNAGGYSNTWEWEEELYLPGTNTKLASYMWSIGHTIRPNGEVLEGNPAEVDEFIPLSRENFRNYHTDLIARGLEILGL